MVYLNAVTKFKYKMHLLVREFGEKNVRIKIDLNKILLNLFLFCSHFVYHDFLSDFYRFRDNDRNDDFLHKRDYVRERPFYQPRLCYKRDSPKQCKIC